MKTNDGRTMQIFSAIGFGLALLVPFYVHGASDQYREAPEQTVHIPAPAMESASEADADPRIISANAQDEHAPGNTYGVRAGRTFGILSFSFALVGLVGALFGVFGSTLSVGLWLFFFGFEFAALVLGFMGIFRDERKGLAITGLILGGIALILGVLGSIALYYALPGVQ
jgi:hypothetical protein